MKKILGFIIKWIVFAGVIYALPYLLPSISVATLKVALITAVVLGFINLFILPLAKILTLPVNLLTLGLFGFVLNAVLFWLASLAIPGFSVTAIGGALIGSLIVSVVHSVLFKFD